MIKKITINMVAERAKVSRGTVDRVLNQRPHVNEEVHQRVVQAMRELQYVPPTEEQALALGLILPENRGCTLGIVLPNWYGYFKEEIMRGIEDARVLLREFSVDIIIEECNTNLPNECIEKIDDLVKKGAAGIAICSIDHPTVADKIEELFKKNIPIVTFNSDISDSRRLCYVGQIPERSGRVAGGIMSRFLNPGDHLIVAVGNPEFNAHRARMNGFYQRMYEAGFQDSDMTLIKTYNDYSLSYQRVLEVLKSRPDIKGIYMANHSITGCVEAVREMKQYQKIHIISHDLTDATRKLLESGDIDFTLGQNIYRQGYRSLIVLCDYIQRNIVPNENAEQRIVEIISAENMS